MYTVPNSNLLLDHCVEIWHCFQRPVPELIAVMSGVEQCLHHVQSVVDLHFIQQRLPQPPFSWVVITNCKKIQQQNNHMEK